jgi:hypothetical protein
MAASSREIDRTDKRNRNQKNDSSQERVDDHIPLPKSYDGEMHDTLQRYSLCFQRVAMDNVCRKVAKSGQLWALVYDN